MTQSLRYQLAACCEDGKMEAMVVADQDGLPLAASGDTYACDEVAARMVLVGARIRQFDGVIFGPARERSEHSVSRGDRSPEPDLGSGSGGPQHRWNVQMQRVEVDGTELLVCAVGGTPDARRAQIARGAAGAVRILAAA